MVPDLASPAKRAGTWRVVCDGWHPEDELRRESLFGVGNGWMFLRGTAPEMCFAALSSPPRAAGLAYPGAYLAGCYGHARRSVAGETVPITTLVNLPYPFALSFRVGGADEWFMLDRRSLISYTQWVNLKAGLVYRDLVHEDASGRRTRLIEVRAASMAAPDHAFLRWRLQALNWHGALEVCARLPTAVCNGKIERHAAYQGRHLQVTPIPSTREMALRASTLDGRHEATVTSHLRLGGHGAVAAEADRPDVVEHPGFLAQSLTVQADRRAPVQVEIQSSLSEKGPRTGQRGVSLGARGMRAHRSAWSRQWDQVIIQAPGAPRLESRLRFAAFQLMQTASQWTAKLDVGFPARGWQEGYFGHIFWDEMLAFPFFCVRMPDVARGILAYRHRRLHAAKIAAGRAGWKGAMYPWRSAETGEEETPAYQWIPPAKCWLPDHTRLQHHVGSAIAFDAWQFYLATGDMHWLSETGAPLIVEIARFWASRVQRDRPGDRYHLRRLVGPDEYHVAYPGAPQPGLDDNAYTNLMAAWTLSQAAQLPCSMGASGWDGLAASLEVAPDEPASWTEIAGQMHVPGGESGVVEQFAGFDALLPADADPLPRRDPEVRVDWWLTAQGLSPDAYQVTKQADVLMLLHLLGKHGCKALLEGAGYRLPPAWYERTASHYLSRISHESHLSRVSCAGALADADLNESWKYFEQALEVDVEEAQGNTDEGLHLGALGGLWDVMQRRYLGLQPVPGGLRIAPRLPAALDEILTQVWVRGQRIEVRLKGRHLHLRCMLGNQGGVAIHTEDGGSTTLRPGNAWSIACR